MEHNPFSQSHTFTLYSEPYLDTQNKEYVRILTLDGLPDGPLKPYIKPIQMRPLSPFNTFASPYDDPFACTYAIVKSPSHMVSIKHCIPFLLETDIPGFIGFLKRSGYTVDMDIVKIMHKSGLHSSTNTHTGGKKQMVLSFF